jgi:hypothetical protein
MAARTLADKPLGVGGASRDCGALHKAAHALIAVVTHAEVKPNLVVYERVANVSTAWNASARGSGSRRGLVT